MSGQDVTVDGIAGLSGSLLGLTAVAVALRFIARHKQKARLQFDDWLVVPAWICFAGLTALVFYGIGQGFIGYKEPHNLKLVNAVHPLIEKVFISLDGIAIMAIGLSKLSVLFFYRRIFCSNPANIFNMASIALIVLVTMWTITFFVMNLLVCGPDLQRAFQQGGTAECWLLFPYIEMTVISDFILDIMILALPVPKIWFLHASFKRKLAICGVFLLGLVGLGASCARMVITVHLVTVGRPVDDEDAYQSNTQSAYYILLEAGLTIIAVNLPSLWYFVAGVTPKHVLRSVRSFISLRSRDSNKDISSGQQKESTLLADQKSIDTNCSRSHQAPPQNASVETHNMTDSLGRRRDLESADAEEDSIRVDHSFQRTEEQL